MPTATSAMQQRADRAHERIRHLQPPTVVDARAVGRGELPAAIVGILGLYG